MFMSNPPAHKKVRPEQNLPVDVFKKIGVRTFDSESVLPTLAD